MSNETEKQMQAIIEAYEYLVRGIDKKAVGEKERAYGGIIRAGKGQLVESITQNLIMIAWESTGESAARLSFAHSSFKFSIKKEYVEKIKQPEVKKLILEHIDDYYYRFKPDIQVCVDGRFVMGVECKAYTENAMFKRILVDFTLLKTSYPDLDCVLLELESQLGGDYSELKDITYGSPSTHTLLSYFDIQLNIITLLEGERKVDKPIHKPEFYKPLKKESLERTVLVFKQLLEKYK